MELLRREAVQHMVELYNIPSNKGSRYTQPLQETILFINKWLLYVDQKALTKWRRVHGIRGEETYQLAKNEVYSLFDGLYERLYWWISEIRHRRPKQ